MLEEFIPIDLTWGTAARASCEFHQQMVIFDCHLWIIIINIIIILKETWVVEKSLA